MVQKMGKSCHDQSVWKKIREAFFAMKTQCMFIVPISIAQN
jgi:hypothetical protein